jgi:predicted anti-sigma-YlaC factor YlaD
MNHNIYEEWLFTYYDERSEERLDSSQILKLQAHLKDCESCRRLADATQQVDAQLRAAPKLTPVVGFTDRWQARLALERQRIQRRQTLAALGFSILAATLLFASLLLLSLQWLQSPKVLVWVGVSRVIDLFAFLETAQNVFVPMLQTATGVIPPFWWIIFAGLMTELGVLWIVSYRLLTNPRRITQ